MQLFIQIPAGIVVAVDFGLVLCLLAYSLRKIIGADVAYSKPNLRPESQPLNDEKNARSDALWVSDRSRILTNYITAFLVMLGTEPH